MGLTNLKVRKGGPDEFEIQPDDAITEEGEAEDPYLTEDPPPRRRGGGSDPSPPPRATRRVTKAVREEVKDKIGALLDFPAAIWSRSDPHCAGVYNDQADQIHERLTTIICKNPKWLEWFTAGGNYADWLMLATALAPVCSAIYAHHVAGHVPEDQAEPVDYAQYAAPRFG